MKQFSPLQAREIAAALTHRAFTRERAALRSLADQVEALTTERDALSKPKSLPSPAVFARVLDPQELRVMLQALQAGEMSVSRSLELMEFWLDGNYSDDQVPPTPADSTMLTDDNFPMEVVRELRAKVEALEAQLAAVGAGGVQRLADDPYGHVTTHTVTGQQFFYRWPERPYLDTAKECIAVYTKDTK